MSERTLIIVEVYKGHVSGVYAPNSDVIVLDWDDIENGDASFPTREDAHEAEPHAKLWHFIDAGRCADMLGEDPMAAIAKAEGKTT